jgi:hypothetical protein
MLLNHGKIKLVKAKPMVLQYADGVSSDATAEADQNNVTSDLI